MTESVGQQLRQARQERGLSLDQAAQETHIRLHFLEAMEAGDFHRLASRAQVKGFIRAYAAYLGVPSEPLLLALGETPTKPVDTSQAVASFPTPGGLDPLSTEERQFFVEIGARLKSQREQLGLSIEDVERHTHLRDHYLRALEAGDQTGLPSPVQGRGMLHNYATFLGLDPEPLLLLFAEGLQTRQAVKRAAQTKKEPRRRSGRFPIRLGRYFSGDTFLGVLMVLFLVGFVLWGAIQINTWQVNQQPTITVPSIAEALLTSPEAQGTPHVNETVTPTTVSEGETGIDQVLSEDEQPEVDDETGDAELSVPAAGEGVVQVHLIARQRAWLRVTVDGEVEFDGRVLPDRSYNFQGERQIEVYTGNGAALEAFFNGRSLGTLGIYGQVVERVFVLEGIWTATPTITAIPTVTSTEMPPPEPVSTEVPTPAP
jgi:cytoskeleton protein RodZ